MLCCGAQMAENLLKGINYPMPLTTNTSRPSRLYASTQVHNNVKILGECLASVTHVSRTNNNIPNVGIKQIIAENLEGTMLISFLCHPYCTQVQWMTNRKGAILSLTHSLTPPLFDM